MVTSCSGWVEPLNLECILVNTFAGSIEIFVFLALIFIAMVGARFRMINMTLLIMFGLFGVLMAQFMGGIYFLTVMIAGLVISFGIGRIIKT